MTKVGDMVTNTFHIGLYEQSCMVIEDQVVEEVTAQDIGRSQPTKRTLRQCAAYIATACNIKNWSDDVHEEENTWQSPLAQTQGAFDTITGEEL